MIPVAIESSLAVLDGRTDKANKQIKELKTGTKLLFQSAQGQSKV